MTADFKQLFIRAQNGDQESFEELLEMYKPLLHRISVVNGEYDEDLFQECCIIFLQCLKTMTANMQEIPQQQPPLTIMLER